MTHLLFIRAFALLVLIGLLHSAGAFLYLYWTVWWFDILMHFLGGFWVALVALWMYEWQEIREKFGSGKSLYVALVATLAVGIVWEVWEYYAGLTFVAEGYKLDTATDIVMDLIGAAAAVPYASRLMGNRADKTDDNA